MDLMWIDDFRVSVWRKITIFSIPIVHKCTWNKNVTQTRFMIVNGLWKYWISPALSNRISILNLGHTNIDQSVRHQRQMFDESQRIRSCRWDVSRSRRDSREKLRIGRDTPYDRRLVSVEKLCYRSWRSFLFRLPRRSSTTPRNTSSWTISTNLSSQRRRKSAHEPDQYTEEANEQATTADLLCRWSRSALSTGQGWFVVRLTTAKRSFLGFFFTCI